MNRLLSRVGVRVTSVGLLVAGVVGGVYVGQDRVGQSSSVEAKPVARADTAQAEVDEMQLLKERHSTHAATRAYRSQAEGEAAATAAASAKAAAAKARKTERQAIAKKVAAEKKAAEEKAKAAAKRSASSGGGSVEFTGDIPASCDEFSGNRAIGCALTLDAGFSLSQFSCLNKLWNRESNWRHTASNPSSGAYGIPQSLPGSKMASAGSDWRNNPATQIKWGLSYIKGRYDTPCGAWAHSESHGWY